MITAPRVAGGYGHEFADRGRAESHRMEEHRIEGSFINVVAPAVSSYGAPLTIPKTLPVETYAPATPKIVETYAPATPKIVESYAPATPKIVESYAPATPKIVESYAPASQDAYGSASYAPQTIPRTLTPVLSEADILCQGQPAETVIPIDNNRKFVVCIDTGKGTVQECPKGLWWHPVSRRCERTLGPLEDACASQPCLFGGQCISAGSSYQCQCQPGYDGINCELDARVCQTQQPCGAYAKCQSFRAGAALSHMCIFQDGLAYGLNAQQTYQSPCSTVSGPHALAVNNLGFIMCDGERTFIESCPGGTIWDDIEKACSWPDLKVPSLDFAPQGYGSSYAPAPAAPKLVQTYAPAPAAPLVIPRMLDSYAPAPAAPLVIPRMLDSYAPAPAAPKFVQSYAPAPAAPRFVQSYAPAPAAPKFVQSYAPAPAAPKFVQSYAPAPAAPLVIPKVLDSYAPAPAAPLVIPKVLDSYAPAPAAPVVAQSYGAQIPAPRQLLTSILTKSSGY